VLRNKMERKVQDLEVEYVLIGAGLPRTGTTSTFTALEKVLPGKCHHMMRAFLDKNDPAFWSKASKGNLSEDEWKNFIRKSGLSASVDFPTSLYWKDLVKMYPNAKVLLTVRDPVKWYLSVKNTIRQTVAFMSESWAMAPARIVRRLVGSPGVSATFTVNAPTYLGAKYPKGMFGAVDAGEDTAVQFFNDWKEQVIKEVPPDRLLVFDVREGWEPLCKFLGVPKPDEPFPNINDTKMMQTRLAGQKRICYSIWAFSGVVIGLAAYLAKDYVKIPTITFS